MTQADFVAKLAGKMELSKAQAKIVFDAFSETLAEVLEEDGEIRIADVGRLYVKDIPAREYRNPQDGTVVSKGARKQYKLASKIKE